VTTVNWLATIQMPCPHDCERFGGKVPGHVRGSNWDWVPCWCDGTGTVDVWLVGPWDGVAVYSDNPAPFGKVFERYAPPADLVALTEPCDHGFQCGEDLDKNGGCLACYGSCSNCFDGRPAVEVENVELCEMCDTDCRDYGRGECKVDGVQYGPTVHSLGRGTIRPDPILPVIEVPDTYIYPKDKPERFVYVSKAGALRLVDCITKTDTFIAKNIDVSPGQFVAIVTPKQT
jgi:hypothetical protein